MIVRGFKSVLWVGAVGGAALSCYMVSLRVATERADLAKVERQIVDTKRDIRTLETELSTRGRLAQLEDWNSNVLALSAPSSSQFVKDGYQLAQLATHDQIVQDRTSAVRMASLETGQPAAPAAKPDAAAQPKPAEAPNPKSAPAALGPAANPIPRVVEAVAPAAPRDAVPVRRASFETIDTAAAPKAGTPQPMATAAEPAVPAKKVKTAATAKPIPAHAPAKLAHADVKAPAKPAKAHAPAKLAHGDAKAPAKPTKAHAPAKLARADGASRPQSSGHRGGAQ